MKCNHFRNKNNNSILTYPGNNVPSIQADIREANITINQLFVFTITVEDEEVDMFTFDNTLPDGHTFTELGDGHHEFSWTATNRDAVNGLM